ncbi:T9SS type A sorting domain-containing protein [bacterium]|nr:T9SS type A sorting domain-containing protein [bacterium]
MRLRAPLSIAAILVALAAAAPASAQYSVYYGNFHSHSTFSADAQGGTSGPPSVAFPYARDVAGIDILAVTDHSHYLTTGEYATLQNDADAWTTNGTFVAIAAQEHGSLSTSVTGAFGHMNVWEAASVINQSLYRYNLSGTFSWLASNVDDTVGNPLVAGFNHPYNGSGAGSAAQFYDFAYDGTGDTAMQFVEVLNGKRSSDYESEYFEALGKGWHIGALGNQDNHEGSWGDQPNNIGNIPLTGVWAVQLTKADVLEALAARRTYAMEVDPPTDRISLEFTMDGHWMGSEYDTAADSLQIHVAVSAETPIASLQLYRNGTFLKSIGGGSAAVTWDTFDTPGPGNLYYVVKVNQNDGDHAWSSPIWVNSTSDFSLPIATVNGDDGSGLPNLWFQTVTVQGLVTVDTDTLDTVNNRIFIQDATGGLMVLESNMQTTHFVAGDNVLVTGTVDTFKGQTLISAPSNIDIQSQGGAPPAAVLITTNQLETQGETWEGALVELRDVAIVGGTWPSPGFDGSVTIDDGSGPATLFLDKDTVLDDLGTPAESTFCVLGIVVQDDAVIPYDCCHAVMPRFGDDIFQLQGVDVSELPGHETVEHTTLHANRPNPVVTHTDFRFDLAGRELQPVRLDLFDVTGRLVRTLVDKELPPGEFEVSWNRRDGSGARTAAGVYFVRLTTATENLSRKIVVLR